MCARPVNLVILSRCWRARTCLAPGNVEGATTRAARPGLAVRGRRLEGMTRARVNRASQEPPAVSEGLRHRGRKRPARVPCSDTSSPRSRAVRMLGRAPVRRQGSVTASSPTASVAWRTRTVGRTRQLSRWAAFCNRRDLCGCTFIGVSRSLHARLQAPSRCRWAAPGKLGHSWPRGCQKVCSGCRGRSVSEQN